MNVDYFSLPLSSPLATADGDITDRTGYLVTVDDPAPGIGEATPLPGWTESLESCEAALRDADPNDLDALPPAARHGVALALLDAEARHEGVPLYQHLGTGRTVETVPVNATVGDADDETTARRVERAAEAGFPAVKLKVGARSLDADLSRIAAARDAAPDVELRADANGAWSVPEAERAFDGLAAHGVSYVEQPLDSADLEGHAALRGRGVDVALDEALCEHGLDAVLTAGAADVLVLKPMVLGGPDIAVETAVLARGAGIDPVVTTTIDGAFARAAAVHVAAAVPDVRPCGLATGDRIRTDFIDDPAPVRNGFADVPQKEGNTAATSPADYA
ncbi:mandelate racemase/muconate lactonizing enzyme family protein [Halorarius halobius]|uniref:mandelate racemase/muconate lactonizing enzyme family protein n=1 Tax=Halorarius halobius TaxID=2962671 RepID=UPI0020CEE8B3|nr:o-succinylbenzoate synthase [Halorarius halobius]